MSSQSTTLPPPNQITDLAKFRFQGVPLLGNLFQAFVVFQQFLWRNKTKVENWRVVTPGIVLSSGKVSNEKVLNVVNY